ncbi:MAG: transposase, partial [Acidimicrobiales bacterium]
MTLGLAERQGDLLDDLNRFCGEALGEDSIYSFLHRERDHLFPDEFFADLFSERGRRSVPPSVVAVVMVLQRLEGLSDREAVERYTFDARWRYAAGVGGYDCGGWGSFAHTVLVDMRERLRRSEDRDRIFRVSLETAEAAGLVGHKRVLDSTPLYDAVTTMDTVTLIRSAIRGLLRVADADLAAQLRAALSSGDDYASAAKPQIDWTEPDQREALIDSRAKDGFACLSVLDGAELDDEVRQAGELLAKVLGQDLEEGSDGSLRIARKVAKDRVISTVDPDARHGHKTAARSFDGYKGHVAVDPDSEIITGATSTPGNAGDASVAAQLIEDLLGDDLTDPDSGGGPTEDRHADERRKVFGDNAYGTGEFQARLEDEGIESGVKTQAPNAPGGLFTKDRFDADLVADTVTCPAGVTVSIRRHRDGTGTAYF